MRLKKSLTLQIIGYGFASALLIWLLKVFEFQFYVRNLTLEIYLGIVAILFSGFGIWLGLKLTRQKAPENAAPQQPKEQTLKQLEISEREYEVLFLMAKGCSNQEIADQLFISIHTIKTHSSNLYQKLGVNRRTQAVQKARDLKLIL